MIADDRCSRFVARALLSCLIGMLALSTLVGCGGEEQGFEREAAGAMAESRPDEVALDSASPMVFPAETDWADEQAASEVQDIEFLLSESQEMVLAPAAAGPQTITFDAQRSLAPAIRSPAAPLSSPPPSSPQLAARNRRAETLSDPDADLPAPGSPQPMSPISASPLPAGARPTSQGFARVQVFYATDRLRSSVPLSAYELTSQKRMFFLLGGSSVALLLLGVAGWFFGRMQMGATSLIMGGVAGVFAGAFVLVGQPNIEKHGVTYSGDRGELTRGLCEVTVPDSHQRGVVERPSLLRFEFKEDQEQHVVLTSAVELTASDFEQRLAKTLNESEDGDLLVFIHGFNVSFEAAVQRTAQIAVDLPFAGVPVCYSWPSQASLVGYPIDETNAAWTTTHLKQFLLELVNESGARSINVIAHSMGNRPMTAAMEQIRWQMGDDLAAPFDRIVLAAPDVDADRFRRDLAPSLLRVADQVTLYASSDDQALIASKQVHGYPRAGESGVNVVVVPGVETIDVSGIDLSLLGHSYYGDNESMLRDLYEVVRERLPANQRSTLIPRRQGSMPYWQLAQRPSAPAVR